MAVKMLERRNNKSDWFISASQTDIVPLDSERTIWIRSGLNSLGDAFDISFGVFKKEDCDSLISSFALEETNLLTLADLPKISAIMAEYLKMVIYKRCHRRNSFKCDVVTFSPVSWGRYVATKRVLRQAKKELSYFSWNFIEENENGVKDGSVEIEIN